MNKCYFIRISLKETALCRENNGFLTVKDCGTYSNHKDIKSYTLSKSSYNKNVQLLFIKISQKVTSLCRKNNGFLGVKNGGTYSNHYDIKC